MGQWELLVIEERVSAQSSLFIDPDKGITHYNSQQHITLNDIISKLENFEIVFSFDQSFQRGIDPKIKMNEILGKIACKGIFGFYYISHANFMFCSSSKENLTTYVNQLLSSGLPENRILKSKNFT